MLGHRDETITKNSRRRRLTILGTVAALLIQMLATVGEGVAAGSDDARAVEAGRRSDPAAAQRAALKLRMDEMRDRRRGRRQQWERRLRRLTPHERRRRIEPKRPRRRERDLSEAFERVNDLRRRFGGPPIAVRP